MKDNLFENLAEALEMEPEQIHEADEFRDYDHYSSLSELSVLAMLDSEYGIEIEMDQFNKYRTVGDLLQLVTSKSVT